MTLPSGEYRCAECGHSFNKPGDVEETALSCPRCGGKAIEHSRYLLGSADAEGLAPEDYYAVCLKL